MSHWIIDVLAILLSPLIALRVQKILDKHSEQKKRKEEIFNTLMETRAQPVSLEHVRALNKIDVAFFKDKRIINSWNEYRDHLGSYPKESNESNQTIWASKVTEKLTELLFEMAKLLEYNFDKVLLQKGAYMPLAHGDVEREQAAVRKGLEDVFALKNPLKVEIINQKPEKEIFQ